MMERYKLEIVNNHGDRYIRCEPATDGSWVMFRDVEALQKRVAELEGVLRDLMLPQTPASFAGSMRRARTALGKKDE